MEGLLKSSWQGCWARIGARGDGVELMGRLINAYREPQRKYHTVRHLWECLNLFSLHRDLADDLAEVEIALWFHDSVYDVTAHDNESRSADWAADELSAAGVTEERVGRVREMIHATLHSVAPEGKDQKLIVDIDLAILAAPRDRFVEYEKQVREEYSWVPEDRFCERRAEILEAFLARESIYSTLRLRETFERGARENLALSLRKLRGG